MTFAGFLTSSSDPLGAFSASALEVPHWLTPTIAGLAVGSFTGVVGFVLVLLLVGRAKRRRALAAAGDVVVIPPYTTLPRATPVPAPWVAPQSTPSSQGTSPSAPSSVFPSAPQAYASRPAGFRPSTELSARAFAKMGYEVDEPSYEMPAPYAAFEPHEAAPYAEAPFASEPPSFPPTLPTGTAPPPAMSAAASSVAPVPSIADGDPELSFDEAELAPEEELAVHQPVSIAPVVMVSSPAPAAPVTAPLLPATPITPPQGVPSAEKSAPHPLATIPSSSAAMKVVAATNGASIADLDLDDGATQVCETIFDEPPRPRRRTDPPKIRAIAPTPPRYPSAPAPRLDKTPLLPAVTPPPAKAKIASHS